LCKIAKDYCIIVSYFKAIQFYFDFIFAAASSPTAASTSVNATASSMYRITQF
jgi:hypothetical protein